MTKRVLLRLIDGLLWVLRRKTPLNRVMLFFGCSVGLLAFGT